MLILIEKDSATRVARTVADIDEAKAVKALGHPVYIQPTTDAGEPDGEPYLLEDDEAPAEEGSATATTAKKVAAKKSSKAR